MQLTNFINLCPIAQEQTMTPPLEVTNISDFPHKKPREPMNFKFKMHFSPDASMPKQFLDTLLIRS